MTNFNYHLTRKTLTFKAIGRTADLELTHTFKTKRQAESFLNAQSIMPRDIENKTEVQVSERAISRIASELGTEVTKKNEIHVNLTPRHPGLRGRTPFNRSK